MFTILCEIIVTEACTFNVFMNVIGLIRTVSGQVTTSLVYYLSLLIFNIIIRGHITLLKQLDLILFLFFIVVDIIFEID